jgi:hypothetical protein
MKCLTESMTPLGKPVVPLENSTAHRALRETRGLGKGKVSSTFFMRMLLAVHPSIACSDFTNIVYREETRKSDGE